MPRHSNTPNRITWPIHAAAHDGASDERLEQLLEEGVDPTELDEFGLNALHHAAAMGHERVCKFLVNTGRMEVDSFDEDGFSSLQIAAKMGRFSTVSTLVALGADPNRRLPNGKTLAESQVGENRDKLLESVVSGIAKRFEVRLPKIGKDLVSSLRNVSP